MSEEESIISSIKPIINARKTHKDNQLYSLQLNAYQLDCIKGLLDLYNKEKEKNKELEKALKDEILCFNRMKDIAETLRKENVEYIIQNRQYELNYIPKSKVREKIELIKSLNEKIYYEENVILILEDLQEGDK